MTLKQEKVAIIGGGITGLVAGYLLVKKGYQVSVFEKEDYLGGLAGTFEVFPDIYLEKYYHHLFAGDEAILDLINELGLGGLMVWPEASKGFYFTHYRSLLESAKNFSSQPGKIYPFSSPLDVLRLSFLSSWSRFKFGWAFFWLQQIKKWRKLESITAQSWIRERAGEEVYQKIWAHLLKSKFGNDFDQISMAWLWGKIKLRGKSSLMGLGKEKLGYMKGSFQVLLDNLKKQIQIKGGKIHLNTKVEKISPLKGGEEVKIFLEGNKYLVFDKALATIPMPQVANLIPSLPLSYSEKIRKLSFRSALCLVLVLKKSLSSIYWLNILDPHTPFVGVIEQTNYIQSKFYKDRVIVYLTKYLDKASQYYTSPSQVLLDKYLPHLTKINKHFNKNMIEKYFVFKSPYAQPVVTKNYHKCIPPIQTPLSGIYIANIAQIYPEDRGMNYSVALGRKAANIISS